jgi:hypothetical protein
MPTPTYTPLATVTLGGTASSVTFSSIPATYRDLVLIISGRSTSTTGEAVMGRYNGDSGANYNNVRMGGLVGVGPFSNTATSQTSVQLGRLDDSSSGNTSPSQAIISIMDYSATDKHKTSLSRSGTTREVVDSNAGRWANTAAITSIVISLAVGPNFVAGSTFNLYGVIA